MKKAIKILKSGGVIAFPTETVFGIGASMKHKKAIRRIFKIKDRPRNKPLQILVENLEQAQKLGKFNKKTLKLAKKGWPGPLTLVVYKTRKVSKLITGGSSKVGLRIPDHKIALELINQCGPIVATSANISGEEPALTAKRLLVKVDYILNGKVKSGRASTVIDATKSLKVLRK